MYYILYIKDKYGEIKHKVGEPNYTSIVNYAVNGAVHYVNAVLDSNGYSECIAIGINGSELNRDGSVKDFQCKAYYISTKNNRLPKHIVELDDNLSLLKLSNSEKLCEILDKLVLSEKEIETVVNFIKSTPSLIGSVVSFLPAPITNAFYMIIFLGAFATVIGIVKALI